MCKSAIASCTIYYVGHITSEDFPFLRHCFSCSLERREENASKFWAQENLLSFIYPRGLLDPLEHDDLWLLLLFPLSLLFHSRPAALQLFF